MLCIADSRAFTITWYRDKQPIKRGQHYAIYNRVDKKMSSSMLKVQDADCHVAGNYTCVAANEYGNDQRQFTLTILGKYEATDSQMGLMSLRFCF